MASQILKVMRASQQTIAVAESCTGGLIAVSMSDIPGASNSFLGAIVAYTESAKIDLLGVNEDIIKKFGVVSEEVASFMAQGALQKFASTWAISTTGYSGPTGGSVYAPLGTLCIAVSGPLGTISRRYLLQNLSRKQHQEKSCELVVKLFLKILTNKSPF